MGADKELIDNLREFNINDKNNFSYYLDNDLAKLDERMLNGTNGVESFLLKTTEGVSNFLGHFFMGAPLATMGIQSFGDKTYQNLKEGYDVNTAVLNGATTATLSMLTEKLPLDNFTKLVNSNVGQFTLGAIASQALSEGMEEGLEAIVEPMIDSLVLGKELEYQPNEIFMSVALGIATGGVLGFGANTVPYIKNQRSANQLKADMQTLEDFRNNNNLTVEENEAIDYALNLSQEAINDFNGKSKIGDYVKFEKDEVTPKNYQEIMDNLFKSIKPTSDFEAKQKANAEYARQSLFDEAQNRLYQKGINMNIEQYLNLDENTKYQVEKVQNYANELGTNVLFNTDVDSDGIYDPSTKSIVINPNSELGALTVFTHELTHGTESSSFYEPLKNVILNEVSQDALNSGIETIKNTYSQNGVNLDDDGALKEFIAIKTQDMLGNDKFIKRLIKYNNSLAYRIYEGIKNIVLKTDTLKEIEYNFEKAFRDNEKYQNVSNEKQYLLNKLNKNAFDIDGKLKSVIVQLSEYFAGKFGTRDKLIARIDSKGLEPYGINPDLSLTMDQSVIRKLFNSPLKGGHNDSIDENVIDYVVNHPEDIVFAVKNNWGNYAFIYDCYGLDKNPILMSVQPSTNSGQGLEINNITSMYGKNNLQEYIDDSAKRGFEFILNEKSGTFAGVKGVQFPSAFQQVTTSNYNISKSNEDVNKYSKGLREKDLLAIHNISENNLKKSFDLGGLAMPSIAITKDSIPHDDFGDLSIVFDKETIDPSKEENKVYSRDAWTPTFPSVEYDINQNKASKLYVDIIDISKKYGVGNSVNFEPSNIADKLNGNRLDSVLDDIQLKLLYLDEKNIDVGDIPRKQVELSKDIFKDLSKEELEILSKGYYEDSDKAIELANKVSRNLAKKYKNKLESIPSNTPKFKTRILEKNIEEYSNPNNHTLRNIMYEADYTLSQIKLNEKGGKIDEISFKDKIDSLLGKDYQKWANNKINEIVNGRGISNGKELYTRNGNRKPFNATHDPYNLESVVNNMASQAQTAGGGFGSGFGNLLASTSKQFNNIEEIIEYEKYLSTSDSRYNELEKQYDILRDDIINTWKYKGDAISSLYDFSEVSSKIAGLNKLTPTKIKKEFIKNDYNINDELANKFYNLLEEGKELTTDYFESKPQRAVTFDEAKQIYYPKGTSEYVLNQLRNYGVETIEYDPNIENDRNNKIKENSTKYKFSKGLSIKDLEQIKKIAPNSIDENGNIKDISRQLNEMKENPSSFGLVTIDIGNSLKFAGIDETRIYLTNKVLNKLNNKYGYSDGKIAYLLSNLDDEVVLATDYKDIRGANSKNIILKDENNLYNLSLKKKAVKGFEIDTISSLHDQNDLNEFIKNAKKYGNKIYMNEKSDTFITSYTHARGTVGSIASNDNISNSSDDVKYSKGLIV